MKIILLFILLSSGIEGSFVEEQLLPTKLRVTVIDGLGNFVEEASVTIYENEKDYLASENVVSMLKTDKKGRVTFKNLKPIAYYIQANKEDKNNNGEGVVTSPLAEGRINKVNTVIE
ncbi:MAG: carboxypeptidase regulatory-like domain-containing protein [Ekhidna sp.]|nr:carboxypeptidase regulatory-like domain-containing protein [Ekhidna sp.]